MSRLEEIEQEAKERLGYKPLREGEEFPEKLWHQAEAAIDELIAMVKDEHADAITFAVEYYKARDDLIQARADVLKLRDALRLAGTDGGTNALTDTESYEQLR